MTEQRPNDTGTASADTLYAQAGGPLPDRSAGDAGQHSQISYSDNKRQSDSNLFCRAARQAGAAAHQARDHNAESQHQCQHNVVNQECAAT